MATGKANDPLVNYPSTWNHDSGPEFFTMAVEEEEEVDIRVQERRTKAAASREGRL
jgi:hypothetical protein